ncbi:Kinase protein with adenine nucleotide alpha hydrolases-like domain [Rhynchospora pubera]|uniref:RING-type E3 ubiquitin transferase n=1 Tax=Rhynchospora pubera TaxID=906938 RepID=A0AAV8FMT8_9POAL|nr:Kinase protein with adenine nucleotide alpha hydrolases-like domain [Rhynchospora pubera]
MNLRRENREGGSARHMPLVAVAIDKDKGSQNALKWALDNVVTSKGENITLVHINTHGDASTSSEDSTNPVRDIFLPFRIFCKRKDVTCNDIIIDDTDVAKAIVDFITQAAIEKIVLGASPRGFMRFKSTDVPAYVMKNAPDFCTVFLISKGKASSVRKAVRDAPTVSPLRTQIENQTSLKQETVEYQVVNALKGEHARENRNNYLEKEIMIRSPFTRPGAPRFPARPNNGLNAKADQSDISFVSSGRPSLDGGTQRISNYTSADSFEMPFSPLSSPNTIGMFSQSSESSFSQTMMTEDSESEMNRLRLELKQMMDMYSTACKEALDAKKQMVEFRQWKSEEENRLLEAKRAQEAALEMVERERAKCRAAIEAAEKAKQIAEIEAQMRINAERRALQEAEERKRAVASHVDVRYRKYTIDEIEVATDNFSPAKKVGEGGYGPVYKCYLDHTPVAVKVLRPDASQGRSQFQQEVEILSCIRHPNMVLLLGACPEYGCLVYEYMANGSLEDRLFMRGNSPPIPWQHRFRIAAEIGTGLLFLHQSKPEPLVHRDLKPANILLDKNYVSKISDVGLARLVPPSVADNMTQYRMTSAAGTFCYIDPEYQQTGMLGTKSDVYSFGVILLQVLTGKSPMGLSHYMENAIERGTLSEFLDQTVPDWPMEEAQTLARLALKCTELRRKDRPDLAMVILPELNRLRAIAEENMQHCPMGSGIGTPSFMSSYTSVTGYTASESGLTSGCESSRSRSTS